MSGHFVIVRQTVARILLLACSTGKDDVQVLLQLYETSGRRDSRCNLLESQPLGLVRIEPEDAFVRHSFNQIDKTAHVFSIPADDEAQGDILVRDMAYETIQS